MRGFVLLYQVSRSGTEVWQEDRRGRHEQGDEVTLRQYGFPTLDRIVITGPHVVLEVGGEAKTKGVCWKKV